MLIPTLVAPLTPSTTAPVLIAKDSIWQVYTDFVDYHAGCPVTSGIVLAAGVPGADYPVPGYAFAQQWLARKNWNWWIGTVPISVLSVTYAKLDFTSALSLGGKPLVLLVSGFPASLYSVTA